MSKKRTAVQTAPLLVLALSWGVATQARTAEVTVTTIGRALDSLEATEEVRHFSFETGEEVEVLKVGQELPVGDEVVALTDDLFVELTCPGGSQLHFTGNFRVQINMPTTGQDCAIDSRDGSLDVLTDVAVETCAAGVCAATGGTRYAVAVGRSGGTLEREITVFEGEVEVVTREQRTAVTTRKTLKVKDLADGRGAVSFETTEVTARQVDRWADLYARFDVVNARAAGVELSGEALTEAQGDFKRLHAMVLAQPEAKEPRAELAAKQVTYKVDRAALYHAQRSGLVTEEQVRDRQIDPGRLGPRYEVDRGALEVLIRDQSAVTGPQTFTTVGPVINAQPMVLGVLTLGPPEGASARERARFWQGQLERFESWRESGDLDSRKYLIAARAQYELGDKRAAAALAQRAIRTNPSQSLLTARELAYAGELAGGD